MKIITKSKNETLLYAAEELKKYVLTMSRGAIVAEIELLDTVSRADSASGIVLGLLSELSLDTSDLFDDFIEDIIDVDVSGTCGYIAGSNPRSVLMGVYKYCTSAGCRFLRPGPDGDYVPESDITSHSYKYRKKADYPFRCEIIEGAVSYEHVRDTVIWLPRVGMNLFMMEQIIPYNYMSRWYEHVVNTVKEDEHVSFEQIGEYVIKLEKLIKKCGLQLHALGHGYLLEPYGIHYKKFGLDYKLSDEAREDVALVDGKRELFLGSPNFTQLCFSKDKARLGLVNFLVEYMEKKPYIDFLHVWLSDAANNQCECENCRKMIPTDYYVMMLNELDAELTKRNIETKIVFIMYVDTFWAPEKIKFNNPDRFIMTTALCRSFNKPLSAKRYEGKLPEFVRNDFKMASSCDVSLSFMDTWKPTFDGKRFAFDYYMYTDHFFDPGYFQNTKLILDDIQVLDTLGFHGIMSDQTQRAYFPTALPNAIMGEGLFDEELQFDDYAERYFKASYGEDWKEVLALFEKISKAMPHKYIARKQSANINIGKWYNPAMAEGLRSVPKIAEDVKDFLEAHKNMPMRAQTVAYKLLRYYMDYCKGLAKCFAMKCMGAGVEAKEEYEKFLATIGKREVEIETYFDQYMMGYIFSLGFNKLENTTAFGENEFAAH